MSDSNRNMTFNDIIPSAGARLYQILDTKEMMYLKNTEGIRFKYIKNSHLLLMEKDTLRSGTYFAAYKKERTT